MSARSHLQVGKAVAELLTASWREQPPDADPSLAELDGVAKLVLATGAGGLAWARLRSSRIALTALGRELRAAFELHTLQAGIRERFLAQIADDLTSADIPFLLVKGPAAGSYYPAKGLRPYGDLDLLVPPTHYDRAKEIAAPAWDEGQAVDLHSTGRRLHYRQWSDLFSRSRKLAVGASIVRIPSAEDHLRICCLHLLRHGAWRPLWFCDVAAALEQTPRSFDWSYCLEGGRWIGDSIRCVLTATQQLLSAQVDWPWPHRAAYLPPWFVPTILREWSEPRSWPRPMDSYWRRPSRWIGELPSRWPNPIEATARLHARFDRSPRWPLQLADSVFRGTRHLFPTQRRR